MSDPLATVPVSQDVLHWQAGLQADIDRHFAAAHDRVEALYRREFRDLARVYQRHWQCRRDIPADLAALPRSLWRLLSRLGGKASAQRRLTAKERCVAELLAGKVLQLDKLEQILLTHLAGHPHYCEADLPRLRREIMSSFGSDQATQRLEQAVARWGLSHDSSRDVLLFLGLGVLGRSLSDKVLFGSASVVGMALASSLYLGQLGWLEGLWVSWFGIPAWVKLAGVALGFSMLWLMTPLVAPLTEWLFNRLWSRRRFHRMVDEVHRQLSPSLQDQVWSYGAYLQFIPDMLMLLRQIR